MVIATENESPSPQLVSLKPRGSLATIIRQKIGATFPKSTSGGFDVVCRAA